MVAEAFGDLGFDSVHVGVEGDDLLGELRDDCGGGPLSSHNNVRHAAAATADSAMTSGL